MGIHCLIFVLFLLVVIFIFLLYACSIFVIHGSLLPTQAVFFFFFGVLLVDLFCSLKVRMNVINWYFHFAIALIII